jgi:hypothetical protein
VSLFSSSLGPLSYFPAHNVRRLAESYLTLFELLPSHYCQPWSTVQASDSLVKVAKVLFTFADLAGFKAFHFVLPAITCFWPNCFRVSGQSSSLVVILLLLYAKMKLRAGYGQEVNWWHLAALGDARYYQWCLRVDATLTASTSLLTLFCPARWVHQCYLHKLRFHATRRHPSLPMPSACAPHLLFHL